MTPRPRFAGWRHPVLAYWTLRVAGLGGSWSCRYPWAYRCPYPARAGGPWLCSTLVLSLFHAVVVPSGFRTRVQPHRWIDDLVVERAEQHAVLDGCLPAVGLVLDVVHLARRGGLVAPPGPLAVLVPQDDRVADPGRDGLGVPDVQRQAGPAQPDAELPAAQEAGQPAGTGQQVHRRADDRLLERLPGLGRRPGRGRPAHRRCPRPRRRGGARSSSTHSRTRSSSAAPLTSPVTTGAIAASHAIAPAASPSSHAPPSLAALGRGGAVRGPLGADLRGPLLLQRGAAVQPEQVSQGDMRPDLDRLTGPLRQQARRDQAAHRLWPAHRGTAAPASGHPPPRPGRTAPPARPPDHRGALRVRSPVITPAPWNVVASRTPAVPEAPLRVLIGQVGAGPLVHLGEQRAQVPQLQARRGGRDQQLVGLLPELLRQLAGPLADRPAIGLGQVLGGQRRDNPRMGGSPAGPRGMRGGGATGDPESCASARPGHCSPRPPNTPCRP